MDELKKLEEQKTSLHSEIEKYGIKLEEIQKEIASAKELELNIEDLKKEVENLSICKNDLLLAKKEVSNLEIKKASILLDIENCKKTVDEISEKNKEIIVLEEKIKTLNDDFQKAEQRNKNFSSTLSIAENNILQANKKISELEKDFNKNLQKLEKDFSEKKSLFDKDMFKIEEEITSKKKEYNSLASVCQEKDSEIIKLSEKINDLKSEYKKIDDIYTNKKIAKEAEISELGKSIKEKEDILSEREGNISLKESTFEKKRNILKDAKARLEKELGKTINIEI